MKKILMFFILILLVGGVYIGIKGKPIHDIVEEFKNSNGDVISNVMDKLIVSENTIKKPRSSQELVEVDTNQSYLYQFLTPEQQHVYKQILTGIENFEDRIGINPIGDKEIGKCLEGVLGDHPEFFWLTGDSTIWMNKTETRKEIEMIYNIDKEEIEHTKEIIINRADDIINGITGEMTDYDKIKYLYEVIILNTDYQLECEQNQNIQSVILYQKSVCAGYAKTFQYLMDRAGLFCGYITGKVKETQEEHAWNIVRIDGEYYYVDCTWGDPAYDHLEPNDNRNISYDYLCLSPEELYRTHQPNQQEGLPTGGDHTYDYYRLNYYYADNFDKSPVIAYLKQSVENGQAETYLKFGQEEAYQTAKEVLFSDEGIKPAALLKMQKENLEEYQYSYWFNENYYIIKIRW